MGYKVEEVSSTNITTKNRVRGFYTVRGNINTKLNKAKRSVEVHIIVSDTRQRDAFNWGKCYWHIKIDSVNIK